MHKPPPGILQLALPTIASNLLYSLVGIIDIKIVGSLGPGAVAAATTGTRLFFVLQALLMAITAGTTAMVTRAWGAGDREEAARTTGTSLLICTGVAAVLTLPGVLFAEALASFFRLDPEAQRLAATFIRWISLFNMAFAIPFTLSAALRAAGDTVTPLWTGAITNVVNVFLVYGFVYGRFGLPALGVAGAALANGLAFCVGSVLLLGLWGSGRLMIAPIRTRLVSGERIRELVRIGTPAGLEQVCWQGGFLGFLWIVSLYGTAPYAAYGIGVNLLSLSFVVGFGFSIAGSTHVGQHLGARDPAAAARSGWRAMRLALGTMIALGAAIALSAPQLARLMIDDPEVVGLTVAFIYILGAVQPLMAIEFVLSGALRGAGDTRFPFLTVLTGLIGVRLSVAAFCAYLELHVVYVYAALIFDYIVKSTMLITRFARGRWQQIRVGGRVAA
ncbi:MAG: MATE family efflux transporter [Proteobacteria bacterium]|nr:MATE family efflux transporter [Pseudomonadota bacterium]